MENPETLVLIAEAHARGAGEAAELAPSMQREACNVYAKGAQVAAHLLRSALPT